MARPIPSMTTPAPRPVPQAPAPTEAAPAVRTRRQQARLNRGVHNLALAGVFFLALALVLLLHWRTPDRESSEAENRKLAQLPTFSWTALADGSWCDAWADYFSDQFVGRDGWLSLKLRLDRLMGRKESGGVYLCEDDYLIETPQSVDDLALWRTLEAVNTFAAGHGELTISMLVAPNAITVMEELLPENAPRPNQRGTLQMIANSLREEITFVDVTDVLWDHRAEGMFYRTDHHWTSLAARYAFETLAPALGIDQPVQRYAVHTVSNSFEGTLASKSGSHAVRDTVEVYTPLDTDVSYYVNYPDSQTKSASLYVSSALEGKDHYTVFFGGNHPLVSIHTTCGNGRSLLIFKDSYANCFVQFLTPYFETIYLIDPRYYYDDVETVLQTGAVTDVLFLYNLNTFVADTALADGLRAP